MEMATILPTAAGQFYLLSYLLADAVLWSRSRSLSRKEPELLAGAGAGAGILKFRLRLPALAPGQTKVCI
jgi:hypothetical protein